MCPSLIQIGSKTAEKNCTNKQTDRHTNRQTDTTKIMVTWPWTNIYLSKYMWRDQELEGSIPGRSGVKVTQRVIHISHVPLFTEKYMYKLVPRGQRRWRSQAGKVTAGLAENDGSLLLNNVNNVIYGLSTSEVGDQHWPVRSLGLWVCFRLISMYCWIIRRIGRGGR